MTDEIIIEMLKKLDYQLDALKENTNAKFDSLHQELEEVKKQTARTASELEEVKKQTARTASELEEVKKQTARTASILENETNRNVQLLAEGYQPLIERVESLADDVEVIKFDVDIVKKVVTTHSKELNKLGKVK